VLWFKVKQKAELVDPSIPLPDQGAYNAGQKAFGVVVLVGSVVIGSTGLLMWIGTGGGALGRSLVLIHLITVGVVISFFFVHFSMAALIKEERPALVSMLKGEIDADYVEHHHAEWYRAHSVDGQPLQPTEASLYPALCTRRSNAWFSRCTTPNPRSWGLRISPGSA
jgi:formate dehydrogenase gamma subunit